MGWFPFQPFFLALMLVVTVRQDRNGTVFCSYGCILTICSGFYMFISFDFGVSCLLSAIPEGLASTEIVLKAFDHKANVRPERALWTLDTLGTLWLSGSGRRP